MSAPADDSLQSAEPTEELAATGERLVPEQQQGELVVAEHMARYRWASSLVAGKDVLDAASGEGYGTDMLARASAANVIGVDIASEAVGHARERYGHDYRQGDVAELPLDDASRDIVVSFETIEHVEDAAAVLAEFKRVLRPDGVLVISTPNKLEYTIENEFHTREFTPDEFVELLSGVFKNVRLHLQQNLLASMVSDVEPMGTDEPRLLDIDFFSDQEIAAGAELYTLAVCSDGELPPAPRSVGFASGVYEAHALAARMDAWHERAEEAERQVGEWNARALEAERLSEQWRVEAEKYRKLVRLLPWVAWAKLRERRRNAP